MQEPGSRPPSDSRPARREPRSLSARLLGRGASGARRVASATGVDEALDLAAEEAIVRAIESEAFERALERVLRGPLIEEVAAEALKSPAVERAAVEALDSELVDRIWDQLLASDEVQRLIERIAEAPEVRSAITAQGAGLLEDLGRGARRIARRLDDVAERILRRITFRSLRKQQSGRAGLITRGLALVIDAAILNTGFLLVSATVALLASVLTGDSDGAEPAVFVVGATFWLTAAAVYALTFWSLAGQTPGMRFVWIRLDHDGERRIGFRAALKRVLGTVVAVIPFGLGLLAMAFDERRRGWQDRIAGTEVLYAPPPERSAHDAVDRDRDEEGDHDLVDNP